MACQTLHNVYSGLDSMHKYFDPDFQPPLPLVEIPSKLNPFRGDNVRIYAKMMTALPQQNVKALPALNMLEMAGPSARKTIIEPSSGSTVVSLAMISRALYQNPDVHAYVSNKTEESRLRTLQFFGLKVSLYGGPSQPEIADPRGVIAKTRRMAEENEDIFNPGQYENDNNPESHMRWTGPQLLKQLPQINVFCAGMGSAGCVTGIGTHLKKRKPSVAVVGVCNLTGDSIPGPRPFPLFPSIKFPWRQVVDAVEEISSVDAYRLSMSLSREGLICGPSSGMALRGLLRFLQRAKDEGKLHDYADPESGDISCVFLCCDLPYQYLDGYFQRLGEQDFHPIANRSLLSVDTDPYDPRWEVDTYEAMKMIYGKDWSGDLRTKLYCATSTPGGPQSGLQNGLQNGLPYGLPNGLQNGFHSANSTMLLDLRSIEDFNTAHMYGAVTTPLHSLTAATASPFDDVEVLKTQWRELKEKMSGYEFSYSADPESGPVIVVCYHGETARLACSIMRAQGIECYSIKGGMSAVLEVMKVEDVGKKP